MKGNEMGEHGARKSNQVSLTYCSHDGVNNELLVLIAVAAVYSGALIALRAATWTDGYSMPVASAGVRL
jgi:hypothetical protein